MKDIDPSKEATKKSLAGNTAFDEESSDTKESCHPGLKRYINGGGLVEVEIRDRYINNESNSESMNISLVIPTGKTIDLVVNISDTIGCLKWKVQHAVGIPYGDQRINLGGKMLEDDKTLLHYSVHNNAKLTLVPCYRGGGMRYRDGGTNFVMKKRLTWTVEFFDTVVSLKEKIQALEGIPIAQQRLTYAGKQLEDQQCFSHYGIQREATLDIIITLCVDDMVIEFAKIQSATENFDNAYLIDEGGSAKVYWGVLRGKEVAIKRLKPDSDESELNGTKCFGTEVAVLGVCDHANIVKLIGYYKDEKERIIVSEFVARGSLYSNLHAGAPDDAILDWNARLQIALDIASGMEYLHTEICLIHRDLKSHNILLDKDFRAKVADFGIVKARPYDGGEVYTDGGEVYTELTGTRGYLCPYLVATKSVRTYSDVYAFGTYSYVYAFGTYSDVYAFGVILLELISGRKALDTTTHILLADWARRLMEDGRHCDLLDPRLVGKIEESVLKDVANLAAKCVAWEKNDRPSMTDIHSELLSMKLGWKN